MPVVQHPMSSSAAGAGVGASDPLPEALEERRSELTTNGHSKRGRSVRLLIPNLADGSHQGAPADPAIAAMLAAATTVGELRDKLEVATGLLRQLESILTRTGGYMLPEDQDSLRAARAFLDLRK